MLFDISLVVDIATHISILLIPYLLLSLTLYITRFFLSLSRTLLKCSMFTPHTNYNGSLILWKIWRHDYFNDVKYKIPQTSNSDDKTTRDGRSPLTFSIFKIIYSLFWNCEAELNFFRRTIVEKIMKTRRVLTFQGSGVCSYERTLLTRHSLSAVCR